MAICRRKHAEIKLSDKIASLNSSWQSNKGTLCVSGLAGIEPMQSKSERLDLAFSFANYTKGAVKTMSECLYMPARNLAWGI